MVHYPIDFPADAARVIVKNFRGGTIASDPKGTAEAAWNLVGYGLSASIGAPDPTGNISMAGPPGEIGGEMPSDEEMIGALESHDALPAQQKLVAGALPIPPKLLIKWGMNLAIRIIGGMI